MRKLSLLKILFCFSITLSLLNCSRAEEESEVSNAGESIVNKTLSKSFKKFEIVTIDTKSLYDESKNLQIGQQVTLKIPNGTEKDFEVVMTKNNLLEKTLGITNSPEENAAIKPLDAVALTGTSTIANSIQNFSSLTIGKNFISGVIANDENDGEYYIEPISLFTQDFNDNRYIIYNTRDVIAQTPGCGTPSEVVNSTLSEKIIEQTSTSKAARWKLQIAVHGDYEAYQYHGNSDYLTAMVIIARVNDAKRYYAWYFNMDIVFGRSILVFNNPNNALYYPTAYDTGNLLIQTQNFWNFFLPNTTDQRDIVMLYSGKPITDFIGRAYTDTVCNIPTKAYAVVVGRNYSANKVQIAMAHEIGHAFGCKHDDSTQRSIMHSVAYDRTDKIFTTNSINAINFHLWVSGSCLNN